MTRPTADATGRSPSAARQTLIVDGITAGILGPAASRAGHDLAAVAKAISRGVGNYETRRLRSGRSYRWAEFTTVHSATGTTPIELLAGGDDFGSPSGSVAIRGLPLFWGGIRIDDTGERRLILGGIRLGSLADPRRMLLITPTQPMLALIGVALSETVRNAAAGRPLRDVVSATVLDGIDLTVKKWRDLTAEEMGEVDQANAVPALGAKLRRLPPVAVPI